jgi:hypothetical protein
MLLLQEILFSTVGGLRGGLALILVQTVVAAHTSTPDPQLKVNRLAFPPYFFATWAQSGSTG